jgi:ferredoxin
MTRITADVELCEGYGNCVFEADDYFALEDADDGVVQVLRSDVAPEDQERVELAVGSCPVAALLLSSP